MTLSFLVLALTGACDCNEKTDEERLREMVDTTSVHVYVAAKVAVAKTGDDATVMGARTAVLGAMEALSNLGRGAASAADDAATRAGDVAEVALGTAESELAGDGQPANPAATRQTPPAPAAPAADAEDRGELSLAQVGALGAALWQLRTVGAEVVRNDSEDELAPVLPVLLRIRDEDSELADEIDLSTDHALFFLGLWALKVHPKGPVPIPHELLLYEASHVDADQLAFEGLAPIVLALRAQTYATAELCDLSARDGDALLARDADAEELRALIAGVGGEPLTDTQTQRSVAALRGLAHGSAARCYFARDESEEALASLRHFVDDAEQAGVPADELALVRAYLAYEGDDLAAARGFLVQARQSESFDDETKADINELLVRLDRDDTGFVDGYFDKAFFARFVARVTWRSAERIGVVDAVADTDTYRAVHDFVEGTGRAVGVATLGAGQAVEAAGEAASEAASMAASQATSAAAGAAA